VSAAISPENCIITKRNCADGEWGSVESNAGTSHFPEDRTC